MKQTKKPTRNQREFLEKYYKIDASSVRIVGESKDNLTVQFSDGKIMCYSKEV